MARMCNKCLELYHNNFKFMINPDGKPGLEEIEACPKISCNGRVVEVDDNMVYVIRELNRKGYKTQYCCSGHVGDSAVHVYILFEYGVKPSNAPEGFSVEDSFNRICYRKVIKDYEYGLEKSDKLVALEILETSRELMDWVDGLEEA